MTSPPCPRCGLALRWFAEQNSWGCDQCRQMFPPPPVQSVSKPPGSKKGLWIVLGLLVAGGVTTAVVLITRGNGLSGGAATRDEVVKRLFAALPPDDTAAMMKLTAGSQMESKVMDCDAAEQEKSKHNAADEEKAQGLRFDRVAVHYMHAKLVVGDIKEPVPPTESFKKGVKVEECTPKVDMTIHELVVDVASELDGKVEQLTAEVSVAEIDGRWYLAGAPNIKPAAGCVQVGQLGGSLTNGKLDGKQVEALLVKRCTDDKWSEKARRCMVEITDLMGMSRCTDQLTAEQNTTLNADFGKLMNENKPE